MHIVSASYWGRCGVVVALSAATLSGCGGSTHSDSHVAAVGGATQSTAAGNNTGNASLGSLYGKLASACQTEPQSCQGERVDATTSTAAGTAAIAFCNRAMVDSAPLLDAVGEARAAAPYTSEETRFASDDTDTVQTGVLVPNGAVAGCFSEGIKFALFVSPSPSAEILTDGSTDLPFGKQCVSLRQSSQFGPGLDLVCLTTNGWAFDIAEGKTTDVSRAVLKQQYEALERVL